MERNTEIKVEDTNLMRILLAVRAKAAQKSDGDFLMPA